MSGKERWDIDFWALVTRQALARERGARLRSGVDRAEGSRGCVKHRLRWWIPCVLGGCWPVRRVREMVPVA